MKEELFRELGFSEREVKVYFALLTLGETTVGPIATKTRIQHAKIYPTLEKLIDKGLVTYVLRSKTKYFQAQDPKNILNIIKEKERHFLEILPEMQQSQRFSKDKQIATVYEGFEAIKSMFESILDELKEGDFYYVFAFKDEYTSSESASRFLRSIHFRLSEKKIDDKVIASSNVKEELLKNYRDIENIKFKFTNINFPLGLMIINNRVINWVWGERPTAVEIISKQIAQQYKQFFLEMWGLSKNS